VPQREDRPVRGTQSGYRRADPTDQFLADQVLAGARAVGREATREVVGHLIGQQRRPTLAGDAAPLRADVEAMHLHQPIPGELPQPVAERQGTVAKILRQGTDGLSQSLQDDIGWVHASSQARIHPGCHRQAQSVAIPGEQRLDGDGAPPGGFLDQLVGVANQLGHISTDLREIIPPGRRKRLQRIEPSARSPRGRDVQ
jgi:hypothetical protein